MAFSLIFLIYIQISTPYLFHFVWRASFKLRLFFFVMHLNLKSFSDSSIFFLSFV